MKAIRTIAALALLLAAAATPSRAFIFYCSDICDCTSSCYRSCYDDSTGYPSSCGAYGYCYGSVDCGVASAASQVCQVPADPMPAATAL